MSFARLILRGLKSQRKSSRRKLLPRKLKNERVLHLELAKSWKRRQRLARNLPAILPESSHPVPVQAVTKAVEIPVPLPTIQRIEEAEKVQAFLKTTDLIRPNSTLQSSIEGFLLDQRSEHTRRAYGKDLKRFVQFLLFRNMGFGIERLNRTLIIAYKESLLGEGLQETSVDRHLATLRSFFHWLKTDGLVAENPAEGVRFLKPKRLSTTQGFADEEVRKVLARPDLHTRTGALHYAVLMVLFYCGLRRSELCSLRTSQLGKERGHFVIRVRGKGNTERIIVMVQPVWSAIAYYFKITQRNLSQDQPLFMPIRNNRTGEKAKSLDPSMIFYIVRRYAKEAGIVHRVSPHSCRATAISNARDHQVPDRAIQEFAGWATPDMITRYDKRKTAVEGSAAHAITYGIPEHDSKKSTQDKDGVEN